MRSRSWPFRRRSNELANTDRTFGFDTAVAIATEAVDRLRSTAEAHRRVMVLQVMGRHAGWIAAHAGVAAIDLASAGRWGMMAPLRGAEVATTPIDKVTSQIKTVPDSRYQLGEVVSG